jgi:acetate kinase
VTLEGVLVVNAGSSSLKMRLLDPHDVVTWSRDLPPHGDVAGALAGLAARGRIDAVGHRFVHGGTVFTAPAVLSPGRPGHSPGRAGEGARPGEVEDALRALTPLAPLHQPAALAGLHAVRDALPGVAQVACFDTAFHATIPAAAATYAVPAAWRERYHLRRFGFHGLSHAYASRRAAELVGTDPATPTGPAGPLRVVTCHLGAGASLAAVRGGVSVDTTMGFTPVEGLVMATRSGSVDPGMLIWLLREAGLSAEEVGDALELRSGMLALAGTADMRAAVAAAAAGDAAAAAALEVYLHRLRGMVASMAAAAGGIDVLVFTGGVGEGSAPVRAGAAAGLGFLGVAVDEAAAAGGGDHEITAPASPVRTFVVAAREDVEIARGVRAVLTG